MLQEEPIPNGYFPALLCSRHVWLVLGSLLEASDKDSLFDISTLLLVAREYFPWFCPKPEQHGVISGNEYTQMARGVCVGCIHQ